MSGLARAQFLPMDPGIQRRAEGVDLAGRIAKGRAEHVQSLTARTEAAAWKKVEYESEEARKHVHG
jgi:hypothetical protein